ncbi:S9 family peptidase [Planococcus lenghuensis]|uniref:Peptidase n=1 Tax=Planococcus lenghuensis TaxID=2213202 RepID=A0A1Q2KXN9_9BACL|nr:S9 family peptidase [Planococcus lenghuensis]AQQ52577.1 peptidase [Planococcus lenghuensis]
MKKAVDIHDLAKLASVTDPQLSPDGRQAVFIKTVMDEEENTYRAQLWHADLETEKLTQWTFGKERVSQPRWSADGKQIAFLSDRTESKQLYVLQTAGGEAHAITSFERGVETFCWAPSGKKIWFGANVKDGGTFTDKEEKKEKEKEKPEPVRVTKMKYKMDGAGLLQQDVHQHIGIADLETGSVQQVTAGNFNYLLQTVSHDGNQLVYAVTREENLDFIFRTSLFLYDVHSQEETKILEEEGSFNDAAFSKDDQRIAFVGNTRGYENATHAEVYVYNIADGSRQTLTESLDAPVGDYVVADIQQGASAPGIVWTQNNDLYFQVSVMGDVRLYFASLDGAIYPASGEGEHIYGYAVTFDGERAVIAASNPVNPGELYILDIASGERKALTAFNSAYLEETELIAPEELSFSSDEFDVNGWLMKPYGYEEGQKFPLVVNIHGGPHAFYANTFFHEMQLLAARGFGVLYINPRGSHSYSQIFVDAVRGDYGGGDYRDIMRALDTVLAENDWIDEKRLGVTGGSYGGFMTNWIVGHTNRFKAAVTQRSISNWISFFGVSDIGYYFSEWQHFTDMREPDKLWEISPLKYAENVETPLLILHGENDYRCPIEQAEQLFITLKHMKKETEFVRFPESSHNLSRTGKPNLRYVRLEEIVGWMEKHLNQE